MNEKTTLRNAIDQFPQYLQMKGDTQSTAQAYLCDVKQFYIFIREKYKNLVYTDALNRTHLLSYFLYLQGKVDKREFKRPTFDRKCDSLIVFCKYLIAFSYTEENLLENYKYSRVKKGYNPDTEQDYNPYVLSEQELSQIFELIVNSPEKSKFRDLVVIQMLTELGIRRSTLLSAKWEDVDFTNKTMTLHHVKDKNTTKIKISEGLCDSLIEYQFVANRLSGKIVLSNRNLPLSCSAFDDLIKKYLFAVGAYQKGATSHSFRHTFITKALRNNMSPFKIIRYTGHQDVSSLKPYENLIPIDLDDICNISAVNFKKESLENIA